jgi:hypothetical protein
MPLIDKTYVKTNFEQWGSYCVDSEGLPDEDILQKEMDLSIVKFSEYLTISDTEITEPLRLHLLNIVRKRCWQRNHGDTEFKELPQILKDYNETIKTLMGIKEGTISLDPMTIGEPNNTIIIKAKPRRYSGFWFNEDFQ